MFMTETEIPTPVAGYQRIGSVGDLRIQYLAAISQSGPTRIWVVGYFHNQTGYQEAPDAAACRSELCVLVWRLVRMEVVARWAQATASCRTALQSLARYIRPRS